MKISHNWLQTYFEKKIPDAEKLAELFTFHSCEVEGTEEIVSIEKTREGDEHIVKDFCLDLKILPDRAHYTLSHRGIAREVAVLTDLSLKDRSIKEISASLKETPIVKIENPRFCRRYTARYVEINKIEPSFLWMKTALEAIDQRAINSIVDVTNYVMYDIGQPLHAFDADKVKGTIVVRAAKEGEKITLLDGREITLTSADNVIADDEGPLVIAGAKGGKRAEISETTRRIIIESANFDPTAVRRTSTKYDIRSESSKRFENEITPELAIQGLNNVCALIQEIMPEAKFGPITDEYPAKTKQTVIEFDPSCIEERLGIKVPLDVAKNILEKLGITVEALLRQGFAGQASPRWNLTIPYERLDLNIKEDIVEEIGRIYGYDHIKGILPPPSDKPVEILPSFYWSEKIKNILIEEGFSEVSLYTLVADGDIETAKPLAKDKAFVRKNLTKGLEDCLKRNTLNADLLGLEAVKIFEIGHVFSHEKEETYLVLGAAQIKKVKGLKSENIIANTLKVLEEKLGTKLVITVEASPRGIVEINLDPLFAQTLPPGASYKDLNFGPASPNRYKRFSLYPFIVRDVAVFVPESVADKAVWQVIEKSLVKAKAEDLLVRQSLFDTFKKEGRVSYAFRLVFQAMDRTLTDEEANKVMETIYEGLKKEGWEVR